jgi:hypothetical protein
MTFTRTFTLTILTLGLATVACKGTKEEQACRADARWSDQIDPRRGDAKVEPTPEELAACVESLQEMKLDIDEEAFANLLDCKIAAKDVNQWAACFDALFADELEVKMDAVKAKIDDAQASDQALAEAAIAKLDVHVGKGISAETIASLRKPSSEVPPARIAAVADDARTLIETGRVDAEHPVSIRLQPGFNHENNPVGLEGAELTFVDAASGATVGRVAPLAANQLGIKTKEITALVEWLLEQPDSRRVELIAGSDDYGGALVFEPPEILRDTERFEKAGLADRPLIWLNGKPYTAATWWTR